VIKTCCSANLMQDRKSRRDQGARGLYVATRPKISLETQGGRNRYAPERAGVARRPEVR
jgi:hypothetical protein